MKFSLKQATITQNKDLVLKIRDNELEVVKRTKYLDVQIDCSLDWKERIKAVSGKVSRAVGFLKTLYKGIVEPHFRYCFSGGQNEDLKLKIRDNELEVVQKTKIPQFAD